VTIALLPLIAAPLSAGETWRHQHIATIPALDSALDLAVHENGEITVVGASSGHVGVQRLLPNGDERWATSAMANHDYVIHAQVVPDSQDVLIAATSVIPYAFVASSVSRYDALGNALWSKSLYHPIADVAPDGSGGIVISGDTSSDDNPTPIVGYLSRFTSDGSRAWTRSQDAGPHGEFEGEFGPLATDALGNVFVGSRLQPSPYLDGPMRIVASRFASDGAFAWAETVLSSPWATVSDLSLGADGSVTLTGRGPAGIWIGRVDGVGHRQWFAEHESARLAEPLLTTGADGSTYVTVEAGTPPDDTSVLLAAYGVTGELQWERYVDLAPSAPDKLEAIAITPGDRIGLVVTANERLAVLQFDDGGHQLHTTVSDFVPSAGTALAATSDGKWLAAGVMKEAADSDFLTMAIDSDGQSLWNRRWGRIASEELSFPRGVSVLGNGGVVSAFRAWYPAGLESFDVVSITPTGSTDWVRSFGWSGWAVGFDREGAIFAVGDSGADHRAREIKAVALNPDGSSLWQRNLGPSSRWPTDTYLLVSDGGESYLVRSRQDSTRTLALARDGSERWNRHDILPRVLASTLGPEERIYLLRWAGSAHYTAIQCLDSDGHDLWSHKYGSIPSSFRASVIAAAADSGAVFLAGSSSEYRSKWAVIRVREGGEIDWVRSESTELYSPYDDSVTLLAAYPDGGAIAGGTANGWPTFVRYSRNGDALWSVGADSTAQEHLKSLDVDVAGNVIAVYGRPSLEITTKKFSPAGDLIWSESFVGGQTNDLHIATGTDLSVALAVMGDFSEGGLTLKFAAPFPVEVSHFGAERSGEDVFVSWKISGLQPLGFKVLGAASSDGRYAALHAGSLPLDQRSFIHHSAPESDAYYMLEILERGGGAVRHGPILVGAAGAPLSFGLGPPAPNPANGDVAWHLELPAQGHVRLIIHDVLGRGVARVSDGVLPPGSHRFVWEGRDGAGRMAAPGVYFYRLEASGETRSGRLVRMP
jgi:hypothetical protein